MRTLLVCALVVIGCATRANEAFDRAVEPASASDASTHDAVVEPTLDFGGGDFTVEEPRPRKCHRDPSCDRK